MSIRINGAGQYNLFSCRKPLFGFSVKYKEEIIQACVEKARKMIEDKKVVAGFRLLYRLADAYTFDYKTQGIPKGDQMKSPEEILRHFVAVAGELTMFCAEADEAMIEELTKLLEEEGEVVAAAMLRLHSPRAKDNELEENEYLAMARTLLDLDDSDSNVLEFLYSSAMMVKSFGDGRSVKSCWEAIARASLNACEDGNLETQEKVRKFLQVIGQPLAAAIVWLYL